VGKLHHVHYINAWIISAVCIHNFALKFEHFDCYEGDEFFDDGRSLMAEERTRGQPAVNVGFDLGGLREGKERREELKSLLFESRSLE
jgi:hypothetical protein